MGWPWRRHPKPDVEAAQRAAAESKRRLADAREQGGLVDEVVAELRRMQRQNNFVLMIRKAWGEPR